MPKEIEIPILIVLIIVTGYFYIKGVKKSRSASEKSGTAPESETEEKGTKK